MKKRILVFFCIVIMMFLSYNCTPKNEHEGGEESKITIGMVADGWLFFLERSGTWAAQQMFLPLVYKDNQGEWEPALAERWAHSDDYKDWTFFLRNDVKWHDGTPTTAYDVKFTMDLLKSPLVFDWRHGNFTVEVIDDYSLIIKYKQPRKYLYAQVFYPKHILEKLDPKEFWEWDFWKQPIGNGPYRFVRHVPGIMSEVEVNPDFYGEKPRIERVVFKFLNEPSLTELLSGNVDALDYVSRGILFKLPENNKFCAYHFWVPVFTCLYWNHKNPLFEDVDIRKALTMGINREELAAVVNYPEDVPLLDTVITERQFLKEKYPKPISFDPEKAQELLEASDWSDSDGDGIRERNGKKFRFTAIVRSGIDDRIAVYVQSQLRKIGIRMDLQNMDKSTFYDRRDSGDFEAVFSLISNMTVNPLGGHLKLFGRNAPSGYRDSEISDLLDSAARTVDPEKKDDLYQKIQQILLRDIPTTFLLPIVNTSIVHCRIKGLSSPYKADPLGNLASLWIEKQ
jgi:peptide/nickel transport system substrate-binding protein